MSSPKVSPSLTPMSAVKMRPVEWLLPFVPLGKLTIVAGQMDQGKSLLSELWAAEVTCKPASVLMFASEDDAADTTRPRLQAAGADLERVFQVDDDALDAAKIESYCDHFGDVRLITVDPITAFFPSDINPWKTPAVRRFLRPFIELAQRRRLAIVGLLHTNRWSDSADPLSRMSEAQGIPQVARNALILGTDPADPDRRILATAKNNLEREKRSAAFRIEEVRVTDRIAAPRLMHEGRSATTATELFGAQRKQSPAVLYLTSALADGPRLQAELEAEAGERGITYAQLRTAKGHVGAVSRKRGLEGWEWHVPTGLQVPT
jgi:putative DNA primase/helicase